MRFIIVIMFQLCTMSMGCGSRVPVVGCMQASVVKFSQIRLSYKDLMDLLAVLKMNMAN